MCKERHGKNWPLYVTTQYLSLEMYGFNVSCFAILFDAIKYADPMLYSVTSQIEMHYSS